jgi:hypothetical protein
MANPLITTLNQSPNTFKECRLYLLAKLGDKETLFKVEASSVDACLKYYISFLEYKELNISNVISYYTYERPDITSYWELLKISIIGAFRKLEKGDTNFDII